MAALKLTIRCGLNAQSIKAAAVRLYQKNALITVRCQLARGKCIIRQHHTTESSEYVWYMCVHLSIYLVCKNEYIDSN